MWWRSSAAATGTAVIGVILLALVSPPSQDDTSVALADEESPDGLRLLQRSSSKLQEVSAEQGEEVSGEGEIFDYVVVGAGTAGSLIVNRLSQMGNVSVALVEVGTDVPTTMGDLHPAVRCSLYALGLENESDFFKEFTQDDTILFAPKDGCRGIQAKAALGGTSSLAVGVHFWDNGLYFSELAKSFGEHWSLNNAELLKIEEEMLVRKEPRAANSDHQLFAAATFDAAQSGVEKTVFHPLFGSAEDGLKGILQTAPRYQYENGSIRSAYAAFLRPILDDPGKRESIKVISGNAAQFVEIQNGKATGVAISSANEPSKSGKMNLLQARREVVLAAGAIGSPALLKRSGLEVSPLQDQADIRVAWPCKGCSYMKSLVAEMKNAAGNSHIILPTTEMTLANYGDYGILVDYKGSPLLITASTERVPESDCFPDYGSASVGGDLLVAHVVLLQPKGFKGEVTADGDLDLEFRLSDPADIDAAVWGVQLVRRAVDSIARADGEGRLNATLAEKLQLEKELWPGEQAKEDQALAAFLQKGAVWSFQSASSSCALGPVLDGELRVKGVQGLRVADASVLPRPPPYGRPLFATLAAAEVASKLLRKDFEASARGTVRNALSPYSDGKGATQQ